MNQVTRIQQILQPHLGWHGAGVSFLALFLIAVFRVKTVNLAELATAFIGTSQSQSHYKRLQRFLGRFELDYYTMARFVISLMAKASVTASSSGLGTVGVRASRCGWRMESYSLSSLTTVRIRQLPIMVKGGQLKPCLAA